MERPRLSRPANNMMLFLSAGFNPFLPCGGQDGARLRWHGKGRFLDKNTHTYSFVLLSLSEPKVSTKLTSNLEIRWRPNVMPNVCVASAHDLVYFPKFLTILQDTKGILKP